MANHRELARTLALSIVVLAGLILSVHQASASQKTPAIPTKTYYFGFEENLQPWLPVFNGLYKVPGLSVERITGANGCPDMHGNAYANLKISSGQPSPATDGSRPLPIGAWILAPISVAGPSYVTVDYSADATSVCPECQPMVYVGTEAPTNASQFFVDKHTLTKSWQQLRYATSVEAKDQLYVAVGFNSTNASIGLDCITITVDPILTDSVPPAPSGSAR